MNASRGSVFVNRRRNDRVADAERIVISGLNWLGDNVMCMPALDAFRQKHHGVHITMLTKAGLADLWTLSPTVDHVVAFQATVRGTFRAVKALRDRNCTAAFVLPNSVRSSLIPFLARVPSRRGARGHLRAWTLTEVVDAPSSSTPVHQSQEYFNIFGLPGEEAHVFPILDIPAALVDAARERTREVGGHIWVGMMPGAARGPSKQWPATHFSALGRQLCQADPSVRVLVFGTASEGGLCERIAADMGDAAMSFAGRTTLPELAALLKLCRVAVTNDSGGMHLAAAAGTAVVAVFGVTDPLKTGPLGRGHVVVAPEGINGSRDIPRDSPEARRVLEGITPERVHAVVETVLERTGQ